MTSTLRFQLLICLMVYASSVHSIMVKYGTKDGPIEPPTPEPLPPPQPYRAPAPVWEERSDDSPDPNAHWKPQLFMPQPRYTQVIFNPPAPTQQPLNNAQSFVNSYKPTYQPTYHQPIKAQTIRDYLTPAQILSSRSIPGVGIRYFVPAYVNDIQARKEDKRKEDAKHNDIETNEISETNQESSSDLLWQYEKEATKRTLRNTLEGSARSIYVWPAYVQPRH